MKPAIIRLSPVVALLLLAALWIAGCHSARPAPRAYDLKGKVVSLDQKAHTLVVEHGPIPGLMDAMTMAYASRDNEGLSKVAAGDKIRATVKVDGDTVWLEEIQKLP